MSDLFSPTWRSPSTREGTPKRLGMHSGETPENPGNPPETPFPGFPGRHQEHAHTFSAPGHLLRFDPDRRRRTLARLAGYPCPDCQTIAWHVNGRGDATCQTCARSRDRGAR